MRTNKKSIEEITLRLKAPEVALERIVKGQYLPRVFAKAALSEIKKLQRLTEQITRRQNG